MVRAKISGPQKTVEVGRGLFVLHYADAEDKSAPPQVRVEPRGPDIAVIGHPDGDNHSLRQPGSLLIVRAERPSALLIEVNPATPRGSVAVSLKLEPLDAGIEAIIPAAARAEAAAAGTGGLRVLAHVAGIGDLVVDGGTWVGGPSAPSRIEGIALTWPDMPGGLRLRYATRFGGPRGGASAMTEIGGFAGTRQRAIPLAGLDISLEGEGASEFRLVAEALFLGAPVVRSSGRRITVSGPTGREPLVGLRLQVEEAGAIRRKVAEVEAPIIAPIAASLPRIDTAIAAGQALRRQPSVQRSGHVRVFRSAPKADLAVS